MWRPYLSIIHAKRNQDIWRAGFFATITRKTRLFFVFSVLSNISYTCISAYDGFQTTLHRYRATLNMKKSI